MAANVQQLSAQDLISSLEASGGKGRGGGSGAVGGVGEGSRGMVQLVGEEVLAAVWMALLLPLHLPPLLLPLLCLR